MAGCGSVRSVFVPSRISPPLIPAAGQHPVAAEASPAPSAPADGPAAPAALPATRPTPTGARGDAPAEMKDALALMDRYVRRLAFVFSRGKGFQKDMYNVGLWAVARAYESYRGDSPMSFRAYAWRRARWAMIRELRLEMYETRHVDSGDAPLSKDVELPLFETLPARQPAPQTPGLGHAEAQLRQAVGKLRGRERTVLELLLQGQAQQQIADALGVSHQRVQQITVKAFARLRRRLTTGYIAERLDRPAENRAEIAAALAKAQQDALPEESSGMLASSWPGSSERIPGFDYGRRWRSAAKPAESPQENEPHDPRE